MLGKIVERIETTRVNISEWAIGFVCILFVRFILESISSPAPSGLMPTDTYTLVHYGLFFLSVALGLTCIVGFFTKNYLSSSKFILFVFPIMWMAPLIDITLNRSGSVMSYIYALPNDLFIKFLKFPLFTPVAGITTGMFVQIVTLFLAMGLYSWIKTKKIIVVMVTLISCYIFMFMLGAIPSLLYAVQQTSPAYNPIQVTSYIESLILNSNIIHNTIHEGTFTVSRYRFFQIGFDKLMSQILFIISLLLTFIFFWKSEMIKTKKIIENSRPIRVLYYLVPMIIAMGYAIQSGRGNIYSWVDVMGVICLLFSWFGMWMYSVHLNDIYDVEIDMISNKNRPLIGGLVTKEDMKEASNVLFIIALLGSWCAGFYSFFFVLVGLAVAYVYSTPPLRFRRLVPFSSFLISVVMLSAILSGFFFISTDKKIQSFPTLLSLGILLFYTLQINFKDIKDIEGDRNQGILTLPVVFPNYGIQVTGVLFGLSFLIAPIFLNFYLLYIVSVPLSVIGYLTINKKLYKERNVFLVHFVFLISMVVLSM